MSQDGLSQSRCPEVSSSFTVSSPISNRVGPNLVVTVFLLGRTHPRLPVSKTHSDKLLCVEVSFSLGDFECSLSGPSVFRLNLLGTLKENGWGVRDQPPPNEASWGCFPGGPVVHCMVRLLES